MITFSPMDKEERIMYPTLSRLRNYLDQDDYLVLYGWEHLISEDLLSKGIAMNLLCRVYWDPKASKIIQERKK